MRGRLTWSMVSPVGPGAAYYTGDHPNRHPSAVPDGAWHEVTKEAPDVDLLRAQAATLAGWAESGEELIRDVRLEAAAEPPEPDWEEVPIE